MNVFIIFINENFNKLKNKLNARYQERVEELKNLRNLHKTKSGPQTQEEDKKPAPFYKRVFYKMRDLARAFWVRILFIFVR